MTRSNVKQLAWRITKGVLWTWAVFAWFIGMNWALRLLADTSSASVVVGVTVLGGLGTVGWIATRIPRAAFVSWFKEHIDL